MDQGPPERTEARLTRGVPPRLGSVPVLARFVLRVLILAAFAPLGDPGFGRTFASLLAMAAVYCACVAPLRREGPFDRVLTHWDEAVGYTLIGLLASSLS